MSEPQKDLFDQPRHAAMDDVLWLENLLDGAKCWLTAKDIMQTVGGRVRDRDIRELASASGWIISGQKGYRHMRHASPEEINHATNWLESQAKKMGERAGAIRSNAHKIFG